MRSTGLGSLAVHLENAILRRAVLALRIISGPLLVLISLTGEATAADIRVFSGGAPQEMLRQLGPEFEQATGHRVELTFRLVNEIQQKLVAGERADVIVLPVPEFSQVPVVVEAPRSSLRSAPALPVPPARHHRWLARVSLDVPAA